MASSLENFESIEYNQVAMNVKCSVCNQEPGEMCSLQTGNWTGICHYQRHVDAETRIEQMMNDELGRTAF